MDIKLEIFAGVVADAVNDAIRYIHIDTDDVINSVALKDSVRFRASFRMKP